MLTLLDDLPRIVEAALNGENLTRLELLALADAYTTANRRIQALESALDTAQTIIGVRAAVTGVTEPLKLAKAA